MLEKDPLTKFEDDGEAAILRYDLPSSMSYSGTNFIELTGEVTEQWFKEEYRRGEIWEPDYWPDLSYQ